MRIVPVVEFEPSDLGVSDFLELLDSGQWRDHWQKVLASHDLTPLIAGSWMVPVESIKTPKALQTVVRLNVDWSDGEIDCDEDNIAPASGGYAFVDDGDNAVWEPGCCCDLSNLADWSNALNQPVGTKTHVMVGHARHFLTIEETSVHLVEEPEVNWHDPFEKRWALDDWNIALPEAEAVRDRFQRRLLDHLLQYVDSDNANRISRKLVGCANPHVPGDSANATESPSW